MSKKYTTNFLEDTNGSTGSANQVLVSTSTGVDWVDGSGSGIIGGPYLPLSAGSTVPLSGKLYAQDDIYISGEHVVKNIDTNLYLDSASGYNVLLRPGGSEKVRIQSNGNVGIGTTSPAAKLHIEGDGSILRLQNNNSDTNGTFIDFRDSSGVRTGYIGTTGSNDDMFVFTQGATPIRFFTNNTESARITSAGNVGIGTTAPLKKLSISGGDVAVNNGNSFIVGAAVIGNTQIGELGADSGQLQLLTESTRDIKFGSTTHGNIMFLEGTNGNVGIGTTAPERSLHLNSSSNNYIRLQTTVVNGYAGIEFKNDAKAWTAGVISTDAFVLSNGAQFSGGFPFTVESSSPAGAFVIKTSGNVGIGTTSPTYKLDVVGSIRSTGDNPQIIIGDSDSAIRYAALKVKTNGGDWLLSSGDSNTGAGVANSDLWITRNESGSDNRFRFRRDSPAFWIYNYETSVAGVVLNADGTSYLNGGNVGIGTTSPDSKLEVLGVTDLGVSGYQIRTSNSVGNNSAIIHRKDSGGNLEFRAANDDYNQLFIQSGGNIGIGTSNPTFQLHVNSIDASDNVAYIHHNNAAQSSGDVLKVRSDAGDNTGSALLNVANNTGSALYVRGDRKVGIGTTAPSAALHVKNLIGSFPFIVETPYDRVGKFISTDGGADLIIQDSNSTDNGNSISVTGDTMGFQTAGSNRIKILANGNVGIGTTAPNAKLEVNSAITFSTIDTFGQLVVKAASGSTGDMLNIGVDTANSVAFIQAVERGIDTIPLSLQRYGGNVGIGTTNPTKKLEVVGNAEVVGTLYVEAANNNIRLLDTNDSTVNFSVGVNGIFQIRDVAAATTPFSIQKTAPGNSMIIKADGEITLGEYGAGTLVSDASGNITVSSGGGAGGPYLPLAGGTMTGDIILGDGIKASFGTGSDLNIYHNGNNGIIQNLTGGLYLLGGGSEQLASFISNGAASLFYDNVAKLETTSTGVAITGAAEITGKGTSSATITSDGSSTLTTKGYVDGLITGATIYRGAWDPSGGGYGSPDLSGVTQTSGYYYICSADGTAEPNGTGTEPDTWAVGDWVIYNDVSGTGQWQKIDNSSVLSGVGTGQTVALWEGAGSVTDSETLGNAPITVSGNDSAFAGNVSLTGGSLSISGDGSNAVTFTESGNGDFTIDAPDDIRLDAGGGDIVLRAGGTEFGRISSLNNSLSLSASGTNKDIFLIPNGTGNVGIGTTAPVSLLEISQQLSAASTIDYPYTISSRDDGNSINQAGGEGVGIKFRIAGNATTTPGDSLVGASIAAIRESASDTDSSTGLGLFVTQNDETLDEALRIDHDGNVGIGTTAPGAKLEVSGSLFFRDFVRGYVGSSSTQYVGATWVNASDGVFYVRSADVNKVVLDSNGASYFNGGNVGIGTTAPSQKLEIALTSNVSLANQPAEPLFVSNSGQSVDGRVFISVKHDVINTAIALGAGLKMTAGAVTTGTASYFDSLIFLESAGSDSDTVHSAPKAIRFYVNNHGTAAGSGANYNSLGDMAMTIAESANIGIGNTAPSQKLHVGGNVRVTGAYYDSGNSPGTAGQVLSSTATGTDWVDAAVGDITGVTAGTGMTGGGTSGAVTLNVIGGDGITANADNIVVDSTVVRTSGTQTIAGLKTFSSDVVFSGATSGAYFRYDASEDGVKIVTPTDKPGLQISVYGGGQATVPQFTVGRSTSEYLGIKVDDRISSVIHRQDETDAGTMQMNQEIWDSGTGVHKWNWISADGAGASASTKMTLNKTGELNVSTSVTSTTFLGDLNGTINTATTGATQTAGNNSTLIATTAYVDAAAAAVPIGDYLPLAGGTMTGQLIIEQSSATHAKFKSTLNTGYSTIAIENDIGTSLVLGSTGSTASGGYFDNARYIGATSGELVLKTYSATDGTMKFLTGGQNERMRITTGGNVGIGTTNPSQKLQVEGNADINGVLFMDYGSIIDDGRFRFGASNDFSLGFNSADSTLRLAAGNTLNSNVRLTVDSTGNVGIGTTAPSQKLHVTGSARITGKYYDSNNNAGLEGQVLKTKVVGGSTTGTDWDFVTWTPDIWQVNPTTSALTAAATLVCDTVKEFEGTTQTSGAGAGAGEIRILDAGLYEINYSVAINVTDTNVSTRQVVALYLTAHPLNGTEIKIPGSLNSTYLRLPGTNQGGGTSFSNTAYYMVPVNTDIALKIDWIDGNTKSVNIVEPFSIQNTIAIKRIGDYVEPE